MTRLPLALALLLVASASGHRPFARSCCGCLRNPVSAQLEAAEIAQLRGYVQQQGVTHYEAISDSAMQAIFRFNLINNFQDVVPSSRSGVLQVITESLSLLTDKVVPSVPQCGQIAGYLKKSVPALAAGGVNIDLSSLAACTSVILHQRGVTVNLDQFNILLKAGLTGFLQSTAYKSTYSNLMQLIATLDYIDGDLPNILNHEELIIVRRTLEAQFKMGSDIFDNRYKLAIKVFEENRVRLLSTFDSLAYLGSFYEVNVQPVIREIVTIFPGITKKAVRAVLDVLKLTNSGGGKATPNDLLAMITIPELDDSLRGISSEYVGQIMTALPACHRALEDKQIQEAYILFIIGLASQGVQPLQQKVTYELFVTYMDKFFKSSCVYSIEAYIMFVIRVVVPWIPRGSAAFRMHIYDSSVVIDNVLVPEKMTTIYKEGRETIIARIRGLQGSSDDITKRLLLGEGEKPTVPNIVNLKPHISPGPVPTYDKFEYRNVVLSALHLQQIANVLVQRFNKLKEPSLQLPLLRILVRAKIIPGTGARAAAAFHRLFQGLPAYSSIPNLKYILTRLSEHRLQMTKYQLQAALQQFYVASRCLGYRIPEQTFPSVFMYTVREYLSTLTSVPAQPFDDRFLEFVYLRLAVIIKQVSVVDNQVPIDDYLMHRIFSVFGGIRISFQARRTIINFIHSSKLLPRAAQGISVISQYQSLLKSLLTRCSVKTFILSEQEVTRIRIILSNEGITVKTEYIYDANVMAYIALCQYGHLQSMTVVNIRQIVYRSIRYFARMKRLDKIQSLDLVRYMLYRYKVPVSQLPVPRPPVYQTPVYRPPPIYILPGISLPVNRVEQLAVILRARFGFVSMQNIRPILAQTVLILRANGKQVVQRNCYSYISRYYTSLPRNIGIGAFNIPALMKQINAQLMGATISGTGVQSALVELYLHMHSLKMPIPSVEVRNNFLSFVLGAYGKMQVRRQVPLGGRFYSFLRGLLPKLTGYMKPFPMFAGPKIYSVFYNKLQAPIYPEDIPLYFQVVRRLKKRRLTLSSLQNYLSGINLFPDLTPAEISSMVTFVREKQIRVTRVEIIRAFAICRLSVGLSSVRISRVQLISIFQQVMLNIVQRYNRLLVKNYVEQILVSINKPPYGTHILPCKPGRGGYNIC